MTCAKLTSRVPSTPPAPMNRRPVQVVQEGLVEYDVRVFRRGWHVEVDRRFSGRKGSDKHRRCEPAAEKQHQQGACGEFAIDHACQRPAAASTEAQRILIDSIRTRF
jgi:hypothetical protein